MGKAQHISVHPKRALSITVGQSQQSRKLFTLDKASIEIRQHTTRPLE